MNLLEKIAWCAVAIAILASHGCAISVEPQVSEYPAEKISELPLPEIILVRRVIPETYIQESTIGAVSEDVEKQTESDFGSPGDDAEPQCIINAISAVIPNSQIVPTTRFWDEVASPLRKMALSRLYEKQFSRQMRDLQIDFLVLAYHVEQVYERIVGENIAVGMYGYEGEKTAATVVIDFDARRVVDSVTASLETGHLIGHVAIVVPIAFSKIPMSDACEFVGEHAANAMASESKTDSPVVLVLVSQNNPHTMTQEADRIEVLRVKAAYGDVRAALELIELTGDISALKSLAKAGDPTAAFALYERLESRRETIRDAWRLLCQAANRGNIEAQKEVAYWHRTATWQFPIERLSWLRDEVGIAPDDAVALMWYTLASKNDASNTIKSRRENLAESMTPKEVTRAESMSRSWMPGNCPSAENRLTID